LLLFPWYLSSETVITGTVKTNLTTPRSILGLTISLRNEHTVIDQCFVESDGTFKLKAIIDRELDLYYRGVGIDTTYIQKISPTDKDTIRLIVVIPGIYKKRWGHAVCPKCNRSDQTVPIQYGLGTTSIAQEINKHGDTTLLPYNKKKYFAGTCIRSLLDPKYFCRRDKIKF